MHRTLLVFTKLLFAFVMSTNATMYQGDYVFTEAYTENNAAVTFPPDSHFRMRLSANSQAVDNEYSLSLKIGNSFAVKVTVTDSDTDCNGDQVSLGPVMSTRMMPPPQLKQVEDAVNMILPAVSEMVLEDNKLFLRGAKGRMIFETTT